MKPFNLEEAKAGKPVCTRHGDDVRLLCFDEKGDQPIVGVIYHNGKCEAETWHVDGTFFIDQRPSIIDLFMK